MHKSILSAILTMVASDSSATASEKKLIEDLCSGRACPKHKTLIPRKEVLKLLGVSAPTLRKYIKNRYLTEIKLSSRKSRFDYDEVLLFAEQGPTDRATSMLLAAKFDSPIPVEKNPQVNRPPLKIGK